jgi:hypothetical protein
MLPLWKFFGLLFLVADFDFADMFLALLVGGKASVLSTSSSFWVRDAMLERRHIDESGRGSSNE